MAGLAHQGGRFYICTTPQTPTLDLAAFEALTYVQVPGVVTAPSMRVTQNTIVENTLDSDIAQIQGGFRQGETTDVVFSFNEASNAGIAAMEAAAQSGNLFACYYELPNSLGTNGTQFYALCFIGGGGGVTGGGGEDFAQRSYSITPSSQLPVEKAAA